MILFHSDLDNTLIYSYKHELGADKTCVEVYQGREISFMTKGAQALLKRIQSKAVFVPTTTRTMEQYQRITLDIAPPQYALVCNGGLLLEHGKKDLDWYRESRKRIEGAVSELERAIVLLEQDPRRCFEIRFLEELFVFTKSEYPQETVNYLRENLDCVRAEVFQNGSKIYVVPKELDKGSAVFRMKERLETEAVIAAGDSEFDIPMLLAADLGMCPRDLFASPPSHVTAFEHTEFTEGMLRRIEAYIDRV